MCQSYGDVLWRVCRKKGYIHFRQFEIFAIEAAEIKNKNN